MFTVTKEDGENFTKIFNKFRKNTKDLRLQQKVREVMFHESKPNMRKKKAVGKACHENREKRIRESYYA